MHAKIEVITPSYARQLLDDGVKNRNVSDTVVLRYAKDMADGNWQANGQGIVLTENGKLLDGQHRLNAIIRADVDVAMLVVRGVDENAFVTMDSGRARKFSDVLHIEGYTNVNHIASAARTAYNYIAGNRYNGVPGKAALSKFVADYPYLSESVLAAKNNRGSGPVGKLSTALGTVMFLANARGRFDPEVGEFMEGVASGQNLFSGDARLRLREWILNHDRRLTGMLQSEMIFSAVAKAWNAFSTGETMKLVRPTPNPTRDNLRIRGFERGFFQNVPDTPQVPFLPTPLGKNTIDLSARPVDRRA